MLDIGADHFRTQQASRNRVGIEVQQALVAQEYPAAALILE